jgi:hypothetical protein
MYDFTFKEIIFDWKNHLSAREILLKLKWVAHTLRCECIIKSSELYNEHKNSYMNILKLSLNERTQINFQHMKFLRRALFIDMQFPPFRHCFFKFNTSLNFA